MKVLLTAGVLLSGIAVLLGAFGAHGLKARITPDQLAVFETGVRYQFYHGLGLIALMAVARSFGLPSLQMSGWFFVAGILLFSGSLYLLSCRDLLGLGANASILGPVTPIGGLLFLVGWLVAGFHIIKNL